MTGVARSCSRARPNGSRVERDGKVVGSRLIGQDFRKPVLGANGKPKMDADGNPVVEADPRYFQSRPSQTNYSADTTTFSNLGPNSKDLSDADQGQPRRLPRARAADDAGLSARDVPVDAITESASGVDPRDLAGQRAHPGQPRRAKSAASRWLASGSSSTTTPTDAASACSASRASTCSS